MDIKWIKLMVDMFDNRKIRYLRKLPEGNSIVLIWVMLLSLAGRCNAGGMIHLTRDIPYSTKMLADELDFEENTVVLALKALEGLGMISQDPISITNWEEYQSTDKMEQIREQNRLRKQKQRALEAASRDCHVTVTEEVTQCHATDIDIDIEEDRDIEKEKENISISIPEREKEESNVGNTDNVREEKSSLVMPVFRSLLEREYKKLSPDKRKELKAKFAEHMNVCRAYVNRHPELTKEGAENVCRMLDWLHHGDLVAWIGMLKSGGGEECEANY